MQRRKFLNSVSKTICAIPFMAPAVRLMSHHRQSAKSDLFPENGIIINDGLGFGIMKLDKYINGIKGGELTIVYSPLDEVSIALLVNAALYGVLRQSKTIDYIVSQSDEWSFVKRALNRIPTEEREGMSKKIYNTSPPEPSLRVQSLELGEPSYCGWDRYSENIVDDTPDAIIIDGVEIMEIMFEKDDIAQQLKDIAVRFSIPVLVTAPINQTIYKDDGIVHPREDFNSLADIHIGLNPRAVTTYKEKDTEHGKYIFLGMDLMTIPIDNTRIGYFISNNLDFNEWYIEFL